MSVDNEELKIPPIDLLREELEREESKYNFRKTLLNIAGVLTVTAAVAVLIATRLLILVQVNGVSMAPTLEKDEIIFLRQTKEVKAGDVIGFYYGGRVLLKRVIAGGGDYIEIDNEGNVYVNDKKLEEPYLMGQSLGKCELDFPYQVPEGMLFVLGDNRAVSMDSRIKAIGCVEKDQIVGKVVFRAWPLTRMGIMH